MKAQLCTRGGNLIEGKEESFREVAVQHFLTSNVFWRNSTAYRSDLLPSLSPFPHRFPHAGCSAPGPAGHEIARSRRLLFLPVSGTSVRLAAEVLPEETSVNW